MHLRRDWLLAALVACCACKSHDEGPASPREKAEQSQAAAGQAQAEQSQAAVRQAGAEAARAEAAAHKVQDTVDRFSKDRVALDAKVAEADGLIKSAMTDDDRKAAMARLVEARKQELELRQRLMKAAEKPVVERHPTRKECLEGPFTKGCK